MRAAVVFLVVSVVSFGCAPAPSRPSAPTPAPMTEEAAATPMALQQAVPQGLADSCGPGETPQFTYGFAALKQYLGPRMGDPTSCERTSAETGDSLQQTTRGLARYLKAGNIPTFTSGVEHWALTGRGVVYWVGRSVTVPADAHLGLGPESAAQIADKPLTLTPTPVPTEVPTSVTPFGPAWLHTPLELIADYDRRHGTVLFKAIESSNLAIADAPDFWAAFAPKTHTLIITPALQSESPEAVATVLAHEGLHAVDTAKYGSPGNELACYTYETSAFRLQAAVWQSFYGDDGKVNPSTELETELNTILELARTDAWRFNTDIKARYQDECS